MDPLRGTRFLWQAAGCPAPVETNGTPIPSRNLAADAERARHRFSKAIGAARATGGDPEALAKLERALGAVQDAPVCAACGEPATHRLEDAISENFTTVKNASRAWPFGGGALCAGCVWCAKTLALRCCLWFARLPDRAGRGGFWFVPMRPITGWPATRPDALAALLAPPPPPFVAGLPLYGIDHGGENNAHRAVWWDAEGRPQIPADPLIKIQSKHTALYAEVSYSAERYRLQVDDAGDITVDVPLWHRLRIVCEALLLDLRQRGVGAIEARAALTSLRPPFGFVVGTRAWRERVAPLQPHTDATWWPLFINLLAMPALVRQERAVMGMEAEA